MKLEPEERKAWGVENKLGTEILSTNETSLRMTAKKVDCVMVCRTASDCSEQPLIFTQVDTNTWTQTKP